MEIDANSYTVKEILALFVVPALADIRAVQEVQSRRISNLERWRSGLVAITSFIVVGIPTSYYVFSFLGG